MFCYISRKQSLTIDGHCLVSYFQGKMTILLVVTFHKLLLKSAYNRLVITFLLGLTMPFEDSLNYM